MLTDDFIGSNFDDFARDRGWQGKALSGGRSLQTVLVDQNPAGHFRISVEMQLGWNILVMTDLYIPR